MSTRDYRGRRVVVWPVNIDSEATLSMGRKIPKKNAVPRPSIDEIVKAAQALGLDPLIENKAYPRQWHRETRRVSLRKIGSKRRTLVMVAREISRLRGTRRSS